MCLAAQLFTQTLMLPLLCPSPPLKLFSLQTTTKLPTVKLHSLSSSSFGSTFPAQNVVYDNDRRNSFYDDDHVIGDCVVFEEGAFDDPHTLQLNNDGGFDNPVPVHSKPKGRKRAPDLAVKTENLVPEEWREVQAEINMTKKERRRTAQELEFNTRVVKEEEKKKGLMPIKSVHLEAFREAKLAQLKPLVLDNPSTSSFPSNGEEAQVGEEEANGSVGSSDRVKPKNPRWAVYGKGFDDVAEFFNRENYDPGQGKSQGIYCVFFETMLLGLQSNLLPLISDAKRAHLNE